MSVLRRNRAPGLVPILAALWAASPLPAPLAPPPKVAAQSLEATGTVATGLLLRRLDGVKRVLMIAAHPDDEDTGLLTVLARGMGAEVAYLSLTRGDGGQNLIGPELFEGLGVIRTGELQAARALDGAEQRFTRAFDFGFSKSAEEALTLWPHEELLADVVWTIRTFRPQIVVSVFGGTPADGHGQHQAAGLVAREAFEAAADPTRFPDQLTGGVTPWAAVKLFQTGRRRVAPGASLSEEEVMISIGDLDPLLARSGFQLAMESRSQHRSQDMGAAQAPGPQSSSVILVASRVPEGSGTLFGGIDTTLVGLSDDLPGAFSARAAAGLESYGRSIERARRAFGPDPAGVVDDLVDAGRALDVAIEATAQSGSAAGNALAILQERRALLSRAMMAASGVVFDVRTSDDLLVPGQVVEVESIVWNGGSRRLGDPEVVLQPRRGWPVRLLDVQGTDESGGLAAGTLGTWRFEVTVPDDAEPSRLYFLREPRDGAMYRWPEDRGLWGLPRDPADVVGQLSFVLGDPAAPTLVRREEGWRHVAVDQAIGEYVEPVLVLPRVSVLSSPQGMVWPEASREPRALTVVVRAQNEAGSRGTVRLEVPQGWVVEPSTRTFDLPAAGTERSLSFRVAPSESPAPGVYDLSVVATDEAGTAYREGFTMIDYPHVERAALFTPARTVVTVVPVRVREGLRVGYVMGTGDDGPEAIRQLGAEVELLDEARVREGDFSTFDVLVLGVRAYEARADVRAANQQILDFARAGGVVVNQYNQYQFSDGGYAPFRLAIGQPAARVSVETQPVRILQPGAPVFTSPNRISEGDFDGWVQERGLYFASEWDDAYMPLIEMNDPGEPARRGSLLVAPVGEGVYVYAALSFFRQWSQGVPGAYRLFANLISLEPSAWRDFLDR